MTSSSILLLGIGDDSDDWTFFEHSSDSVGGGASRVRRFADGSSFNFCSHIDSFRLRALMLLSAGNQTNLKKNFIERVQTYETYYQFSPDS